MFSRKSGQAAASIISFLVVIAIVIGICGGLGAWLWPYTIDTWAGYVQKNPEVKVLKKSHGFWMGVIPGLGQLMVPAAAVTCVCDLIFIPDTMEEVKAAEAREAENRNE